MRILKVKGEWQIIEFFESLEDRMFRSVISYATRWTTISIIAIFTISAAPGIAAAREGIDYTEGSEQEEKKGSI